MSFLRRSHSNSSYTRRYHHHHLLQIRTLYDAVSTLNCPRDRGLDHAVEREKHLKPLLNLKNLIISEPSKSVPLSLITQSTETLGIPFRPIEFVRKYPSVFQEFHPAALNIQPHIKLTPEIISLDSEENLSYQSVTYKQEVARRLLKLLMISRINKIPIFLLDRFKWELGLPGDYENLIIPEFPDYFRVIGEEQFGKVLELVCWIDEFAVSEVEKKGAKDGKNQFCLQHSKDFVMDKKYKKWVDEWQKLPYISPYENAMHLSAKTDESDKWAVSVLHELLNLFVGKKAERDSLLYLGEHLGLRSRFKVAFLQHPGIFYVSSKIGTHTVVLKEGYRRGMLVERHPLMDMRFKYVQLMNVVVGEEKEKSKKKEKKKVKDKRGSEGKEVDAEEDNDETYDSSYDDDGDSDEDDESEEDDDDDSDDEGESEDDGVSKRGRFRRKGEDFVEKGSGRNVTRMTNYEKGFKGENASKMGRFRKGGENSEVNDSRENAGRMKNGRTNYGRNNEKGFERENVTGGRFKRGSNFEENNSRRNVSRSSNGRPFDDGGDMSKNGRFRRKEEDFDANGSGGNATRRTNDRRGERGNFRKGFDGENLSEGGRFKRRGENYEENNSRRNVTGRTYGRPSNDGYEKGFEGENARKRGGFKSRGADFEEQDSRRNGTRRTSGRGNEENAYKSSSRFSKRTNGRSGDSSPRLRTQKPDFSGNKRDI